MVKFKGDPLPAPRTVSLTLERDSGAIVLQIRAQQPAESARQTRLWPQPARPMRCVLNAKGGAIRDPKSGELVLEPDGATPPKLQLALDRQEAHELWCNLREDAQLEFDTPAAQLDSDPNGWADAVAKELDEAFSQGERQMIRIKALEASGFILANKMLERSQESFS